MMLNTLRIPLLLFLNGLLGRTLAQNTTYDYIVVGSGPGGGPVAANLAIAGYSVLLIEAGDDQGNNVNQQVPAWGFMASNDPLQRWDFFVKYHSDDAINNKFKHLTWRTKEGGFYVGLNPPAGATKLGVYYPRAGTLGGCSTHNALASVAALDSDWKVIEEATGDRSWNPANMRKYLIKLENNHYVPKGTTGHGFKGYLDLSLNKPEVIENRPDVWTVLKYAAKVLGQDPEKVPELLQRDINSDNPRRDTQTGFFGFPTHRNPEGRRVSSRDRIVAIAENKEYNLTVKLKTLATKIIIDTKGRKPRARGVEFLEGQSLYSADPRHNPADKGKPGKFYARREVIISGGAFNTPQLLKLSGIGPEAELKKHKITTIVNLPGVGTNLRDNYEISVNGLAAKNLTTVNEVSCTLGASQDPCLELWRNEGKGPYTNGPLNAIMYKTKNAVYSENDLLIWGGPGAFRGFWPRNSTSDAGIDPPSTFGFSMSKIHTQSRKGTVLLRSTDPRDVPEINLRIFEEERGREADLDAMEEGIEFGRKVMDMVPGPLGPFTEVDPCPGKRDCSVREHIRTQAWSHHASSTSAIGGDDDRYAVLDSKFRVRGVESLRVVDASAFSRAPGAFPVLPTFILSEKASDDILRDSK